VTWVKSKLIRSLWRLCDSRSKVGAWFVPNMQSARKSFWAHSMQFHGDVGQVELVSAHLDIVLILAQDTCTVWDEHTIRLETILGARDGTLR
jgi:hypothetical protein